MNLKKNSAGHNGRNACQWRRYGGR